MPFFKQGLNGPAADAATDGTWNEYFKGESGYGGDAGVGYVWTDKTVKAHVTDGTEDGSFDITYSALGSAETMGDPGDPADSPLTATIASGSRPVEPSHRMYYMLKAVNDFIPKFMEQSSENRIAVVVYDSNGYELMPLGRYTPGADGTYITAARHHWMQWGEGLALASSLTANCNLDGSPIKNTVTAWGNTNLMAGIGTGMTILKEYADDPTESGAKRTPVMIAMGDGEANVIVTTDTMVNLKELMAQDRADASTAVH